jgi:hypothetical protein
MISASPIGPATLSMVDWPDSANGQQRMVDAPHRAKQADKGRGGAHRCQDGQAVLQLGGELVNGVAQAAGDPVAHVQAVVQMGLGVAVVGRGLAAFEGQLAKRVAGVVAQFFSPAAKSSLCQKSTGLARAFFCSARCPAP